MSLVELTETVRALAGVYGAFGVFAAAIVEEVIVPIPSALVVLSSGFLLLPPDLSFTEAVWRSIPLVVLPASFGIALGSLFPYFLAQWGGRVVIEKCGWWLGVTWRDIEGTQRWFDRHHADEVLLFTFRTLPIVPSVAISLFSGLVRLPLWEFLFFSFLGSLVRSFALALLGWAAGDAYAVYAARIDGAEKWGLLAIGLIIVGAMVILKHFRRRREDGAPSS